MLRCFRNPAGLLLLLGSAALAATLVIWHGAHLAALLPVLLLLACPLLHLLHGGHGGHGGHDHRREPPDGKDPDRPGGPS